MLSVAYLKHFDNYHSCMGNYIYVNVPTVRRLRAYYENLLCIIDGSYAHYPIHLTRALNRKKIACMRVLHLQQSTVRLFYF